MENPAAHFPTGHPAAGPFLQDHDIGNDILKQFVLAVKIKDIPLTSK